jgi:hypothetical protein|tara:strand:- start:10951 stop:13593 length:2643 start_codon:yes stop_codon:yes gene_type:complete
MATHIGQANFKPNVRFVSNIEGSSSQFATAGVRSVLHKPGEVNNIGLVMFGDVERGPERDVVPSGVNREYGYWRGNTNLSTIEEFDHLFIPLEGSGTYNGFPQVSVKTKTTGAGSSGGDGGGTCIEDPDNTFCIWYWFAGSWSIMDDGCTSGGGCVPCAEAGPPESAGSYDGDVLSIECVAKTAGTATTTEGVGQNVGYSEWVKAGYLNSQLGQESVQQRSLFMSERSYVNAGSGIDLSISPEFTVYSKFVPSGDISNSIILAQHKENPALFVLGCDYDGRFYIRADSESDGTSYANYAKSNRSYEEYKYPIHLMGVYASDDSSLKLYINGEPDGFSSSFKRKVNKPKNTNVLLGKREFPIAEKGFIGWVDEAGISSKALTAETIKSFYRSTFDISNLIFNTKTTPSGGGIEGSAFGDTGLDAFNKTYVEFVVDSGVVGPLNPTGAKGGAYDKTLWGQVDNAVSSVLTFNLSEVDPKFHQLENIGVDMWVEHSTNHASGANISIVLEHPTKPRESLNWYASGVYVPSGGKRLISFNDPIHDSLYDKNGKSSFKTSLEDHKLKIILSYPSSTKPYDGNFKIYSSKLRYRGFDGVGKYNTKDGLVVGGVTYGHGLTNIDGDLIGYESGDRSAPLFAYGGTPVPSSTTMNLVVSAATADQSLSLILNHDPTTDMGDTAIAGLFASGAVVTNRSMNLFTKTGPASGVLNLYLKQPNARSAFPQILPLEIKGAAFTYPYSQNTTSLFLQPTVGTGIFASDMILTMPFVKAPPITDRRLLFIEGRQPKNEITLYLKSNEYLNGNLDLFMKTPGIGTPSGVMGLFAKQRNKTMYAPSSLTSNAAVVTSGTPPLFIDGVGFVGSEMNLVIPSTIGSGIQTTTLTTEGF